MATYNDITGIVKRIQVLRSDNRITAKAIADYTGIRRETVTRQLNGQSKLDYLIPWAVVNMLPDINPTWIFTGQLPKLKLPMMTEEAMAIMAKLDEIDKKVGNLQGKNSITNA